MIKFPRKGKRVQRLFNARNLLIFAVVFSAYQYSTTGSVTWVSRVFDAVHETVAQYANRPDAGWRKATDAIEEMGAAKDAVPQQFDLSGRVLTIADGDTATIRTADNSKVKIRFYGIDSPERGQPYYNEAKRALTRMLSAKTVGVTVVERDQYGRTVGKVYLDGVDINLAMVSGGHAWWYQHYAKYERSLQDAQQQARAKKIGLWADSAPVPPWEWRRR